MQILVFSSFTKCAILYAEKEVKKEMSFRTVYQGVSAETEEKKSRFIAELCGVESKEEAEAFISECKKRYPDARHHCSAYIVGAKGQIEHFSDDGEPAGTAGRPMLEVLRGQKLTNTAVVVTRYFGGVLLGTGGLVRAYTQAVKAGVLASIIADRHEGYQVSIGISYTDVGRLQYFVRQNHFMLADTVYAEEVSCTILVEKERMGEFSAGLTELFSGKVAIGEKTEIIYDAGSDGGILQIREKY